MLLLLLGILPNFMLIMIADSARDLMLNITALEFIYHLDVIFIILGAIAKVLMRRSSSCNDNYHCVFGTIPDLCSFDFCFPFVIPYLNGSTSTRVGEINHKNYQSNM